MADWPVLASDGFLALAIIVLIGSALVGAAHGRLPRWGSAAVAVAFFVSFLFLAVAWRAIAGGVAAAASAHAALAVSLFVLHRIGRLCRVAALAPLEAALLGLVIGTTLVTGIFVVGPLLENLAPATIRWLLGANPVVTIAAAASIDLLHLDVIYRTSPLAHRGVAPPSWAMACIAYLLVGLAAHGASRLRPWSHSI